MSTRINKSRLYMGVTESKRRGREHLLVFLHRIGLATTAQIARFWFQGYKDPAKRASEWLKYLCDCGVLDAYYVPGQLNLYRLSRECKKKIFQDESPVISFTISRVDHRLAIGNTLLDLMHYEIPNQCRVEYKQEFKCDNQTYTYRPDLIVTWLHKWRLFEVQNTTKTSKEWAGKWNRHAMYWHSGEYKQAEWQPNSGYKFPNIIVISTQQESTVTYGADRILKKIEVVRSVHDLPIVKERENL